jgi:hypothetical protein
LFGAAGVISFVLIVVAALVSPPLWGGPSTTSSAQELADYAFPQRDRILAALFIYALAMGFFLLFAAGLWAWLRRSEKGPGGWSMTFALGVASASTMIIAAFAPAALAVYRPPSPLIAGLMYDLSFGLLAFSGIPTALFLAAYAVLVLRFESLKRWTAWVATVGAFTHIVIVGTFFCRSGFFSLEGDVIVWVPATFFAWILVAGVALYRAVPTPDAA